MLFSLSVWALYAAQVSPGDGWIPHIIPPNSLYSMSLFISNPNNSPARVTIQPYERTGELGTTITIDLAAKESRQMYAIDLFEPATSHAWVGTAGCDVYWSYDLVENPSRQPLFAIDSSRIYGATFDWRTGVEGGFGVAVVNLSASVSELALTVTTLAGVLVRSQLIPIGPYEKILIDEAKLCCADDVLFNLRCDQQLALLAAQRSWSGAASSFFPRMPIEELQVHASEVVDFPDPVLKALMIELADKGVVDGQVTLTELALVTELEIPWPSGDVVRSLEGLQACVNLKTFHCSGLISSIEPIADLSSLEELVFPWCPGLAETPQDWTSPSLKKLDLKRTDVRAPDLTGLKVLEELNLSGVAVDLTLTQLPDSLRILKLSGCNIQSIPENYFSQLYQLESLDLVFNQSIVILGVELPDSLRSLNLSSCNLFDLELTLPYLQSLNLNSNHLSQLPSADSFSSLQELSASYNSLQSLSELTNYTNLVNFEAIGCSIRQIPQGLRLPKLMSLVLMDNPIAELPDLSGLSNLGHISLYRCALKVITPLLDLPQINYVDISFNQIQSDQCYVIDLLKEKATVIYRRQDGARLDCNSPVQAEADL